jgi:hypothetical protein
LYWSINILKASILPLRPDNPGEDFSGKGFTKVTFWAKGHKGKDVVIFGSGGTNENKELLYKDSY